MSLTFQPFFLVILWVKRGLCSYSWVKEFKKKKKNQGIPWQSSSQDSTVSLSEPRFQPLVGELRCHKMCSQKEKKSVSGLPWQGCNDCCWRWHMSSFDISKYDSFWSVEIVYDFWSINYHLNTLFLIIFYFSVDHSGREPIGLVFSVVLVIAHGPCNISWINEIVYSAPKEYLVLISNLSQTVPSLILHKLNFGCIFVPITLYYVTEFQFMLVLQQFVSFFFDCGIPVEPTPLAWEQDSSNPWTSREFLQHGIFKL